MQKLQKFGEFLVVVGLFMGMIGVAAVCVGLQESIEFAMRKFDWYFSVPVVLALVASYMFVLHVSRRKV